MNMLFVYQIYAYPRLLSEILKIIDSKIGYENMSNDNYANGWSIFFTRNIAIYDRIIKIPLEDFEIMLEYLEIYL